MLLGKLCGKNNILYLNDRHEEKDTEREDKRKLYEKRILPLLEEGDAAVFAERTDPFLFDYYRSLGLASVKKKNIFYAKDYLKYPSLTKAVLANQTIIDKIKKINIDTLIPYIESYDTEKLSKKIGSNLMRSSSFVDWINDKSNFRRVAEEEIGLKIIPGCQSNPKKAEEDFKNIKRKGYKKIILKKERSASGFGIFAVETIKDLRKCLKDNLEDNFVMEVFIENVKFSPNAQYFVTKENIFSLGASDQILNDNFIHSGNIYPSLIHKKMDLYGEMEEISNKICRYLQSKNCFGLIGIDFVITNKNEIFPVETNVRINGSTFPNLIAKKMFEESENIFWKSFMFKFPPQLFENFFAVSKDKFINQKNKLGILPIGVDAIDSLGEGYFMAIGESHKQVNNFYENFIRGKMQ